MRRFIQHSELAQLVACGGVTGALADEAAQAH